MQDSIRSGHVAVNGAVTTKTATGVQPGDAVDLLLYEPAPIAAEPEVGCAGTRALMWLRWGRRPGYTSAEAAPCAACQALGSSWLALHVDSDVSAAHRTPCEDLTDLCADVTCRCREPDVSSCLQDIPLDVVYEDAHVLVVNKAAGMVVHPSPGHPTGTLVNAVLHHCNLPAMRVLPGQRAPASLDADWGAGAASCWVLLLGIAAHLVGRAADTSLI